MAKISNTEHTHRLDSRALRTMVFHNKVGILCLIFRMAVTDSSRVELERLPVDNRYSLRRFFDAGMEDEPLIAEARDLRHEM
jgi:hypothetical protein